MDSRPVSSTIRRTRPTQSWCARSGRGFKELALFHFELILNREQAAQTVHLHAGDGSIELANHHALQNHMSVLDDDPNRMDRVTRADKGRPSIDPARGRDANLIVHHRHWQDFDLVDQVLYPSGAGHHT